MLVIDLERVLVLAGLHESVSKGRDRDQVVVDGKELTGESAGIGKATGFQISLEQIAQAVWIGIEVRYLLEGLDSGFGVASLEKVAALHEQCIAVPGIEGQHALQNFFGCR